MKCCVWCLRRLSCSVVKKKIKCIKASNFVFPLLHRLRQGVEKDVLGILVSYKIKINLMVAGGG